MFSIYSNVSDLFMLFPTKIYNSFCVRKGASDIEFHILVTHLKTFVPNSTTHELSFLGYDWIRLISVFGKSVAYSQAPDFCCCSLTLLIMML